MDRRDALKKLGMGGATVVGASMVVSSQAFADGGSISSRPTVPAAGVTYVRTSNSAGRFDLSFGAFSCLFGSLPTARIEYGVTRTAGTATLAETAAYVVSSAGSASATVDWSTGLSVTFRIDLRYVCRDAGGAAAWSCRSDSWSFTSNGGGNISTQAGPTSATVPDTCDSSPPAP
jgi:hypothetical protein